MLLLPLKENDAHGRETAEVVKYRMSASISNVCILQQRTILWSLLRMAARLSPMPYYNRQLLGRSCTHPVPSPLPPLSQTT